MGFMKSQETEVAPRFIVSQGFEVVPGLNVLVRAGGRPATKGVPGGSWHLRSPEVDPGSWLFQGSWCSRVPEALTAIPGA